MLFSTPSESALAHEIGADLRGDDLVGPSVVPMGDDAAIEVHDHAFAHGIERTVRSAHADIGVTIRFWKHWLIGEAPAVTDRRGIARCGS